MGFKFSDRVCNIEIEGVNYPVTFQKPLIDRLERAKEIFGDLNGSVGSSTDKICAAFDEGINLLLGEGAAESIFRDRFAVPQERYAVLKYIYDEITAFMRDIAGDKNV